MRVFSRRGKDLHRDLGQRAQRAPSAAHQFHEVVARHVLDDPAAGPDDLAPPGRHLHAQGVVAGRAGLDAPGARKVAGEDSAQRRPRRGRAQQRAEIGRFEREALAGPAQQRLDLGDGRRRAGGQHQFRRLVLDDAGKAREIEDAPGLDRVAEGALRAGADDLDGRLLRRGPGQEVPRVVRVAGTDGRRHDGQNRGRSGNGVAPA